MSDSVVSDAGPRRSDIDFADVSPLRESDVIACTLADLWGGSLMSDSVVSDAGPRRSDIDSADVPPCEMAKLLPACKQT